MATSMTGEAAAFRASLSKSLRAYAKPERAAWDRTYHKSNWEHWGVAAPQMKAAISASRGAAPPAAVLRGARDLWNEPVWDLKIAALRSLSHVSIPADVALWRFVTARVGELDGWALADTLADVGARCLVAEPSRLETVETWVASHHLWTRRGSLVFTLPWAKGPRDPQRMLDWAARLVPDREWFIQKAIGWWLRELGKRDPSRVRLFVDGPGAGLKGFAKREAMKYL